MCGKVKSLQRGPEKPLYEAVEGKPQLPWRPQNIGNTRTMGPLQGELQAWSEEDLNEAMWPSSSRVGGGAATQALGIPPRYIMNPKRPTRNSRIRCLSCEILVHHSLLRPVFLF